MSYHEVKTKVTVESELPEEIWAQVGVHQEFVLLFLIFTIAVDKIIEYASEGSVSDILHQYDLVLISENKENLREKFLKRKSGV